MMQVIESMVVKLKAWALCLHQPPAMILGVSFRNKTPKLAHSYSLSWNKSIYRALAPQCTLRTTSLGLIHMHRLIAVREIARNVNLHLKYHLEFLPEPSLKLTHGHSQDEAITENQ